MKVYEQIFPLPVAGGPSPMAVPPQGTFYTRGGSGIGIRFCGAVAYRRTRRQWRAACRYLPAVACFRSAGRATLSADSTVKAVSATAGKSSALWYSRHLGFQRGKNFLSKL